MFIFCSAIYLHYLQIKSATLMIFTIPEVYNFQQLLPFATNPQKSDEYGTALHF
jgi:hypothetical protein